MSEATNANHSVNSAVNPPVDPYAEACATLHRTINQWHECSAEEKAALERELTELEAMTHKLTTGRIAIAIFGEIDTGKSALINALAGAPVAHVDVRGGWTKDIREFDWEHSGFTLSGFEQSQVVLIDTPGINEVDGAARAELARGAVARCDLILFVTDSDLNQLEHSALVTLLDSQRPVLLVLNKIDNYTAQQRETLRSVLLEERLQGRLEPRDFVETAADPLPREYVIEQQDGSIRCETRAVPPDVTNLKVRILEILEREGKSLLALNAALYAADRSDRIAAVRVKMRDQTATNLIWSFAVMKSLGVALNPMPAADVIAASAADIAMVLGLSRVYGLEMTWANAQDLITSILKAAGWMAVTEYLTHAAAGLFKGLTFGIGAAATALPQGAAAGFGSYIVGQAAKYYLEHGASWGNEAPKTVVQRILDGTDKQSILARLREEIKKRIRLRSRA